MVLIAISVYKTGEIWFDNSNNNQILDKIFVKNDIDALEKIGTLGNLLKPEELAIFVGDREMDYTIVSSGWAGFTETSDDIIKIMAEVLMTGHTYGEIVNNMPFWEKRHIYVTLPMVYSSQVVTENLGIDKNALGNIQNIKTFILVPSGPYDEEIILYVEDYDKRIYEQFTLGKENKQVKIANESLFERLQEIGKSDRSPYISTLKNKDKDYKETVILPLPSERFTYHKTIFWQAPYIHENGFDRVALDEYISRFFENPETVSRIDFISRLKYSDGKVVVTFDEKGLLTYKKNEIDTSGDIDISKALAMADRFIEMDTKDTSTEYKLKSYDNSEDGITFYYSIAFNGFPVVSSSSVDTNYDMSYPIEITVNKNGILYYKRVVRKIDESMPQDGILEVDYKVAKDRFIQDKGDIIDNMYLGYKWVYQEKELELYWIIESGGHIYFYDLADNSQN